MSMSRVERDDDDDGDGGGGVGGGNEGGIAFFDNGAAADAETQLDESDEIGWEDKLVRALTSMSFTDARAVCVRSQLPAHSQCLVVFHISVLIVIRAHRRRADSCPPRRRNP